MSLPSVIKVKGYKLIRNDSFDEVLYSLVLEATARNLSLAITKCVNRAKSLETQLRAQYGLVYYGFEVLTQVKEENRWRAVVKIDYVTEDAVEEDEETAAEYMDGEELVGVKIKDTSILDYIVLLNIIDELEMILMKSPAVRDVINIACRAGIKSPYLRLLELQRKGLIKIKNTYIQRM